MTTFRQLSRPVRAAIVAPWLLCALWLTAATPGFRQLLLDASNHPTTNVDLASSHWTGTLEDARLSANVPLLNAAQNAFSGSVFFPNGGGFDGGGGIHGQALQADITSDGSGDLNAAVVNTIEGFACSGFNINPDGSYYVNGFTTSGQLNSGGFVIDGAGDVACNYLDVFNFVTFHPGAEVTGDAATFNYIYSNDGISAIELDGSVDGISIVDANSQWYFNGAIEPLDGINYPDGSSLVDDAGNLYYPNENVLSDSSGNLYYPNGTALSNPNGYLYYPNGAVLYDPNGNLYTSSNELLMDTSYGLYAVTYNFVPGGNLSSDGTNLSYTDSNGTQHTVTLSN